MNYEIKSVRTFTVFINAFRVFAVVGFPMAILTFFISNGPHYMASVWQKLVAMILFTIAYAIFYALIMSAVLSFIAWLYNYWARRYHGVTFALEKEEE